jgi:hypothetical protein
MNNTELYKAIAAARLADSHGYEMVTQLLEAEAERRENRRLFFATMRRPEMRTLRQALCDLKWEHGIDWRNLTKMEIDCFQGFYTNSWTLIADNHLSCCSNPEDKYPYFFVMRLHDENDQFCECEDCQNSRLCYIRCKAVYIAQPQLTNA